MNEELEEQASLYVLGLLEGAAHALHDPFNLGLQLGDLRFGRVWRQPPCRAADVPCQ